MAVPGDRQGRSSGTPLALLVQLKASSQSCNTETGKALGAVARLIEKKNQQIEELKRQRDKAVSTANELLALIEDNT